MNRPDAIVVGSGPNGLAAAIEIARAGRSVTVFEAGATIGGGSRSAELTVPGFTHDICSAVHPFAVASPFFRTLALQKFGLEWIEPPAMVAHPFDGGSSVLIHRSLDVTVAEMGEDGAAYRRLMEPVVTSWPHIEDQVLGPPHWPRHPLSAARFGFQAVRAAEALARHAFSGARARGLFAGIAAHGMLPLDRRPSAAFGLVLGAMAHRVGWVLPRGGAQSIADALGACLRSLGGEIVTSAEVRSIDELPPAKAVLCDLSPKPLLRIAGHKFPRWYRQRLENYRYGMGVTKVDWALGGPIPWQSAACGRAGTVHLGATLEEIAASERDAWMGRHAERPFVLVSQASLFDSTRAPAGRHTAWTYCHVPHGSNLDVVPQIERQIERFAPGFRDRVLARAVMRPADIERNNANFVGGDIAGGVTDLGQLFKRPTWRAYSTPVRGLYICSASTPPGPGVHGMCGYFAARRALDEVLLD